VDIEFSSDIKVTTVNQAASDSSVVRAARVSTVGKESVNAESDAGLINYLIKNKHGSPFEHNSFTFLVEAPIFVYREWHRHRAGWSYNEESGRYKQLEPKFYVPAEDRNLQQIGKAGHYQFLPGTCEQRELVLDSLEWVAREAYNQYLEMLDRGVAKEVARMCLPVNIYSSMYATCNARSLMHFLSLRTYDETATNPSHPQREIEIAARNMESLFSEAMPLTYGAWQSNGRNSI
jgi:thymidylate synthase (FAD)